MNLFQSEEGTHGFVNYLFIVHILSRQIWLKQEYIIRCIIKRNTVKNQEKTSNKLHDKLEQRAMKGGRRNRCYATEYLEHIL